MIVAFPVAASSRGSVESFMGRVLSGYMHTPNSYHPPEVIVSGLTASTSSQRHGLSSDIYPSRGEWVLLVIIVVISIDL